ncbi:hypothetical protein BDC45DRAFT_541850 [Circinella umbellata]|nr:hypothetical protein BDC45DRAFT_541850 [Circinella umbellata]
MHYILEADTNPLACYKGTELDSVSPDDPSTAEELCHFETADANTFEINDTQKSLGLFTSKIFLKVVQHINLNSQKNLCANTQIFLENIKICVVVQTSFRVAFFTDQIGSDNRAIRIHIRICKYGCRCGYGCSDVDADADRMGR